MIKLTNPEQQWIKLFKGHYSEEYPFEKNWIETAKPLFTEIYGWDPDDGSNYKDFLNCLFQKLLDIQFKISDDGSGTNQQLKSVFYASFYQTMSRDYELPIERAISALIGNIQCNLLIENGEPRYEL